MDELVDAAEALNGIDSKYDAFRTWLQNTLADDVEGGVLLFSHFHATLEYLQNRLTDDGVTSRVITGRTRMLDRDVIREQFRNGEFDILLSSEVGSEGLDQQHCHRMVNYDLPWNPMRIEQRIGRLDRFGQTAEEIEILNLAVEGTIDAAILHRLYHRIRLFEDSLGMLDPLLGEAMRMVARTELNRPLGSQIVPAIDAPERESDGVQTLLDKREMWMEERANDEREWIGPDPGISALRRSVEIHHLGISGHQLREWIIHHLRDSIQMFPTNEKGVWMIKLDEEIVHCLAERVRNNQRIDQDTSGWNELIQGISNQSGPYWLHVIFDREIARLNPHHTFITPYHPLTRFVLESNTSNNTLFLTAERDQNILEADWCICVDWNVGGLTNTTVRRWLYLNRNGEPIEDKSLDPHSLLTTGEDTHYHDLSGLLQPISDALLESETQRLLPLLDELRENAQNAWHRRIMREMGQLSEADWFARAEGREPDPRWVRMKNSLITKLQDQLANRLSELDSIRDGLTGDLLLRVAIKLQ